jgi:hypothetical protein
LFALRYLEGRRATGRRFGADADALWSSLQGDLTTANRLDLLIRDADAEWPGGFGARTVFAMRGVAGLSTMILRLIKKTVLARSRPDEVGDPTEQHLQQAAQALDEGDASTRALAGAGSRCCQPRRRWGRAH